MAVSSRYAAALAETTNEDETTLWKDFLETSVFDETWPWDQPADGTRGVPSPLLCKNREAMADLLKLTKPADAPSGYRKWKRDMLRLPPGLQFEDHWESYRVKGGGLCCVVSPYDVSEGGFDTFRARGWALCPPVYHDYAFSLVKLLPPKKGGALTLDQEAAVDAFTSNAETCYQDYFQKKKKRRK